MILFLFELDGSLMTLFLFQEHYEIYFANKEPEEESRGAYQGEWNMDFCRYGMQSREEGMLHLELFILGIPIQRVPNFVTGCCKY